MTGRAGGVAWAAVVSGAVLWGTGGVIGVLLARTADVGAGTVAAARLGVSALVLAAALRLARRPVAPRGPAAVRRVVTIGVLAAVYQGCFFVAATRGTVGAATFVALGAAPLLVAAVTAARTRTLPGIPVAVALALGVAGLALLTSGPGGARDRLGADVVLPALAAATAFALMTVVAGRRVAGLEPVAMTAVAFAAGACLLVPWAAVEVLTRGEPRVDAGAAPAAIGLVVLLGTVPTAAAYALWFRGLPGVPGTSAALMALLEPVTAALVGALVLGERLTGAALLGAVALVLASALAIRRRADAGRWRRGRRPSPTMDAGLR